MNISLLKSISLPLFALGMSISFATQGSGTNIDHGKYDFGKKVFLDYVVCSTCPFPDETIHNDKLWQVATMLREDGEIGKNLKRRDRDAAIYYLSTRGKVEPKS